MIYMKLAGVVVLYNPDQKVLDNISSYIDELDVLYLVDNSNADTTASPCRWIRPTRT